MLIGLAIGAVIGYLLVNAALSRNRKKLQDEANNQAHPNKDKQDCLSMVLLTYAVDLFKSRQVNLPNPEVLENRLARLHRLLEEALAPDA